MLKVQKRFTKAVLNLELGNTELSEKKTAFKASNCHKRTCHIFSSNQEYNHFRDIEPPTRNAKWPFSNFTLKNVYNS